MKKNTIRTALVIPHPHGSQSGDDHHFISTRLNTSLYCNIMDRWTNLI